MTTRKKVIIDCDPGTDDSQAILMALSTPHVEVLAITTTFGNNTVENTSLNALRTLKLVDRLDIPVYKGCATALNGSPHSSDGFHGFDGMGDVPNLYQADPSLVQPEHSVTALLNVTRKYPGEVCLVAVGPLTNLAVALQLDPTFGNRVKECVIMGGNTTGKGNVTKAAEFNFYSDPEAAAKVFKDFKGNILMTPLEVCEEYSFSWDWYATYSSQQTEKGKFVGITDRVMVENSKKFSAQVYWTWDQLSVAVVTNEEIVLEKQKAKVSMELHDKDKRGMMIVDWDSDASNVSIVTKVDRDKYEKEIYKAVS